MSKTNPYVLASVVGVKGATLRYMSNGCGAAHVIVGGFAAFLLAIGCLIEALRYIGPDTGDESWSTFENVGSVCVLLWLLSTVFLFAYDNKHTIYNSSAQSLVKSANTSWNKIVALKPEPADRAVAKSLMDEIGVLIRNSKSTGTYTGVRERLNMLEEIETELRRDAYPLGLPITTNAMAQAREMIESKKRTRKIVEEITS